MRFDKYVLAQMRTVLLSDVNLMKCSYEDCKL